MPTQEQTAEIERFNQLYSKYKIGETTLADVPDKDMPGLYRACANMCTMQDSPRVIAENIAMELAHRRNGIDQKSRDASANAMFWLTVALAFVGAVQATIYAAQLWVSIYGHQ